MSEAPRDPMRAAQANMRPAAIKRFYKTVEVREAADGRYALTLDGRGARTPGRNPLAAKSRALMLKVAAEWERQRDTVEPADMPLTRLLNSAVDGVSRTMAETRAEVLKYAGSDLLCYRAEEPEELAERQRLAFDPILAWAAETLGARFNLGAGVVHVDQPTELIAAIALRDRGFRRSRCARRAQRDDDALRLGSACARGRARAALAGGGVASRACRRGLSGRALGRRCGRASEARGALEGVRGGGLGARWRDAQA